MKQLFCTSIKTLYCIENIYVIPAFIFDKVFPKQRISTDIYTYDDDNIKLYLFGVGCNRFFFIYIYNPLIEYDLLSLKEIYAIDEDIDKYIFIEFKQSEEEAIRRGRSSLWSQVFMELSDVELSQLLLENYNHVM